MKSRVAYISIFTRVVPYFNQITVGNDISYITNCQPQNNVYKVLNGQCNILVTFLTLQPSSNLMKITYQLTYSGSRSYLLAMLMLPFKKEIFYDGFTVNIKMWDTGQQCSHVIQLRYIRWLCQRHL